jgi:hypothetical protein
MISNLPPGFKELTGISMHIVMINYSLIISIEITQWRKNMGKKKSSRFKELILVLFQWSPIEFYFLPETI